MVLACWALRALVLFSLLLIGVHGGHEICQHGQCQLVPATSVLEYWSMFSELVIVSEVQGSRSEIWARIWAQNPVLKIAPPGGPAGWVKVPLTGHI